MRIKVTILCIVAASLILCIGGSIVDASNNDNVLWLAGQLFGVSSKEPAANTNGVTILATFKGTPITSDVVDYHKKLHSLGISDPNELPTDLEIINAIIESMILLEEAERLGFNATEEEIDAMVEGTKQAYSLPEGKAMIDAYLQGSGLSFDEYLDVVREQSANTITRQKLKDAYGKQFCEENNLEYTKINPPEEMVAAQDAYIKDLIEMNKDNIEYFIDVTEVS